MLGAVIEVLRRSGSMAGSGGDYDVMNGNYVDKDVCGEEEGSGEE